MKKEYLSLIEQAKKLVGERQTSPNCVVAGVASAILSGGGDVFTGVNIDCACGIGFCAEHSAMAEMAKHGETEIKAIVALHDDGKILSPCGRCRELMYQLNRANLQADIIISKDKTVKLEKLLPLPWER
jgi:cytidine deaminase